MLSYRFDINWLKEEFQDVNKTNSDRSLSDKASNYLKIVSEKYNNEQLLPKDPSASDILALQEAYGKALIFVQ